MQIENMNHLTFKLALRLPSTLLFLFCEIEKAFERACKSFPDLENKAKSELKRFNAHNSLVRSNSTDSIVY